MGYPAPSMVLLWGEPSMSLAPDLPWCCSLLPKGGSVNTAIEGAVSKRPSATAHAILGLLAIRPWTTYDLTQQVQRSLRRFWPRAESKLYEEPRKLADLGLATAVLDPVGRRPRTRYEVTAEGRRQLARWLAESSAPPQLESEPLLKVFLAEHGTRADLLATLSGLEEWSQEWAEKDAEIADSYLNGTGPFPARAAQLVLVGRYLADFADMTGRWARWATSLVEQWPDTISEAIPDLDGLREIAVRCPHER